jgi:hypothetical protein
MTNEPASNDSARSHEKATKTQSFFHKRTNVVTDNRQISMGCGSSARVSGTRPISIGIFGLDNSVKSSIFAALVPPSATVLPSSTVCDSASFTDFGTVITLSDFHRFDPGAVRGEYSKLSGILVVVAGASNLNESVELYGTIRNRMPAKPLVAFAGKTVTGLPSEVKVCGGSANDAFANLVGKILRNAGRLVIGSAILAELPSIFSKFLRKDFELLWRGSRDGFGASEFHGRCDGHKNTLVLIEDSDGNVFGGFSPVPADSETGCRADEALESFVFTVKNPHKVPPRTFGLRREKADYAICCFPNCGPDFCDITVADDGDKNEKSYTRFFGGSYGNDTGLDAETFFTGSGCFTVKEIEVFELT